MTALRSWYGNAKTAVCAAWKPQHVPDASPEADSRPVWPAVFLYGRADWAACVSYAVPGGPLQ